MSDTALNKIIQYGTDAARVAFVPNPAATSKVLYLWYVTDDVPKTYAWDGSAWVLTAAGGDVVGPASAVNNDVAVFDGTTGKLIKDGGSTVAGIVSSSVTAAEAAIIPIDLASEVTGDLPFANFVQASGISKLVGRGAASGAGDFQEITLDSSLTMTGTVLAAVSGAAGINQLTGDVTAGPGTGSVAATVKAAIKTQTIGITIDGGSAVVSAGVKGYRSFPVAGTIISWRMLANAAGAVAMEIKSCTYSGFPGSLASITASAPPNIAATNQKAESSSLGTWTTSVSAGDVFEFSITGTPATITRVTLEVVVQVS